MPNGGTNGGGGLLDIFTTIDEDLEEVRLLLRQIAQELERGSPAAGTGQAESGGGGAIVDGEAGGGSSFQGQEPAPIVERTKVIEDEELPQELIPIVQSILENVRAGRNGEVDLEELPVDIVGTASEDISSGNTGKAFFTIAGTSYAIDVSANTQVEALQRVRIIDGDGTVVPASTEQDSSGVSIIGTGIQTDNTSKPGEKNSAEIDLGITGMRKDVDIYYDVPNPQGPLNIEISTSTGDWRPFDEVSQTDLQNNANDVYQMETTYRNVRAWVNSDHANDDLNIIEMSTKGV